MTDLHLEEEFERFRASNDLRALARVFDAAAPQLLSVARHLAPSRSDAEDLLQASFLVAIERAAAWDRGRPLLPWLLGILAMEARRARARAQREPDPKRLDLRESIEPFEELSGREVRVAVESALARLPRDYSEIVRRHLIEGVAPAQLAVQLGLTQGNARTRLHRGLRMMREKMPDGFAGIGVWIWCHWSGPRAVRRPVLERAAQTTGGAIPVALSSVAWLALAVLATLAVAVPFLLRDSAPRAEDFAMVASFDRAPAKLDESSIDAERSLPLALPWTRVLPTQPTERFFGRILLHDGTPAAGLVVEAHVLDAGSEPRTSASCATDSEGAFQISLSTQVGESVRIQARAPAHAAGRWWFRSLEPGSSFDVGEVRLEKAASVSVRVVTPSGEPLTDGWTVAASVSPLRPDVGVEGYFLRSTCDSRTGIGVLEDVPLRTVTIGAMHPSGELIRFVPHSVEARAGVLDLVYSGTDLSRRLAVRFQPPKGVTWIPARESIRLECAAGLKHELIQPLDRRSAIHFDHLDSAQHTLRIEDARYESVELHSLRVGAPILPIDLMGSARLQLSVSMQDSKPYLGPWTLHFEGELRSAPSSRFVWSEGVEFPREGLELACPPGDWRFALELEGSLARTLEVRDLQPRERRAVVVDLGADGAQCELAGRVVSSEEFRPERPLVTLTRGERAGHGLGRDARVVERSGSVPPIDMSTRADASGAFSFAGLEAGIWTVETRWSPWLVAARTVKLPTLGPIELAIPAHGTVIGRVLAPEGRKFENARLIVGGAAVEPRSEEAGGWQGHSALDSDGRFALTAVPTGRVELQLGISVGNMDGSSVTVLSWPLGEVEIHRGVNPALELDARAVFPADILVDVRVDGAAASNGSVRARSYDTQGSPSESLGRVMQLGQARAATLAVGGPLEVEYVAPAGWRVAVSGLESLRPGELRVLALQIETCERDIRVVERRTGTPAGGVRIAWQTGSILEDDGSELPDLGRCIVTTDAEGRARIRLPLGAVRAVALSGGRLEPERFDWEDSRAPVVLEFSQAP